MSRSKLLRLTWVGIMVLSAFALGAFLKPTFSPIQRSLRGPPALPMGMPGKPMVPRPAPGQQPGR